LARPADVRVGAAGAPGCAPALRPALRSPSSCAAPGPVECA